MIETPPAPHFKGPIRMRELHFARKLLDQGLELDRVAQRAIVDRCIELQVREHIRHDESCTWWRGAACDCPEGRT